MTRTTIAPPITRVHKLFRLRTVVNDSTKTKIVTTEEVGKILVNRELSKASILDSPDKLKRARDHALNLTYLGLFIPHRYDHGFRYAVSPAGHLLEGYGFHDDFPRGLEESAVFIDRMLRMKLTNAYDSRTTYRRFRTRPFLSLLTVLKMQALHIDQVHYLLGVKEDLATDKRDTEELHSLFSRYTSNEDIVRFDKKFRLNGKLTRAEIGRTSKPLLDWCYQAGIAEMDNEFWCRIKENGVIAVNFYSRLAPVWWGDLGFDGQLQAALLLFYMALGSEGKRAERKWFEKGSFEALQALQEKLGVFDSSYSRLVKRLDFDFYYDVPVELRKGVRELVIGLSRNLGFDEAEVKQRLRQLSISTILELTEEIKRSSKSEIEFASLSKAFGMDYVPRRESFQTPFEWQVCVRLLQLGLPAHPYQGELEGVCDLPMASDNPDIYLRNGMKSLVECKSVDEWGDKGGLLKLNKRVQGEMQDYQTYVEEVNANAAVFVTDCKGYYEDEFMRPFTKIFPKYTKVILVFWSFLDAARKDAPSRGKLFKAVREPHPSSAQEHVLIA